MGVGFVVVELQEIEDGSAGAGEGCCQRDEGKKKEQKKMLHDVKEIFDWI